MVTEMPVCLGSGLSTEPLPLWQDKKGTSQRLTAAYQNRLSPPAQMRAGRPAATGSVRAAVLPNGVPSSAAPHSAHIAHGALTLSVKHPDDLLGKQHQRPMEAAADRKARLKALKGAAASTDATELSTSATFTLSICLQQLGIAQVPVGMQGLLLSQPPGAWQCV